MNHVILIQLVPSHVKVAHYVWHQRQVGDVVCVY